MLDRLRTRGTATMREMTMYTRAGLPMKQWIMQDLHLSEEEFTNFVKKHKITYDVFYDELTKHTKDGAEKMSHTIGAQMHIMGNNLAAIGAAIIEPFMETGASGIAGLNDKMEGFGKYLEEHQPQIVGFFETAGVKIEEFVAKALSAMAKLGSGMGSMLHAAGTAMNLLDPKSGKQFQEAGDELKSFMGNLQGWADSINTKVIPGTIKWGEQLKLTTQFNGALKDKIDETKVAVAEMNHEGGVEIHDATPSIIKNLEEMKIHLRQIGDDPTHLEIVPDTPQAIAIINEMREKEHKEPLPIPLDMQTDPATAGA
jgi:hypothetical protein